MELERQAIDSIDFVAELSELEGLVLHFSDFGDRSLESLYGLAKLRSLSISNTLPVGSFAEAAARMPRVSCAWFKGFADVGKCMKCGAMSKIMFAGQGEGTACLTCDAAKVEKNLSAFKALVAAS